MATAASGIYVANNRALWGSTPVTIERVEVKNGDGPLATAGISIVGADVTLHDGCSHATCFTRRPPRLHRARRALVC